MLIVHCPEASRAVIPGSIASQFLDLQRELAMKVILGKAGRERGGATPDVDARTLGRFLDEAQVTGMLDHPGIVPVHELGLDHEGRVYFTMRLVQGRNLHEIFRLVLTESDGWSRTRALEVLLKACEALAYAHSHGVVHRDIKPADIMVGDLARAWQGAHDLLAEHPDDEQLLARIDELRTASRSWYFGASGPGADD